MGHVRTMLSLLLLLCTTALCSDLYGVLGLRRSASEKQIKQAYKKLAMQWHPDRNKSPEAKEKFIEIQKAYDVLGDAESKRDYDIHGVTPEERQRQGHGGQHFHHQHFQHHFHQGGFPHGFHHHFFRRMDPIQSSTIQLGSDNWESLVRRGAAPRAEFPAWLVHVYHDESAMCRELSSMWEETGKALRGVLRTGRVHAPAEQRLCRHMGVTSVPAYVLVMQNGSKFTQYGGGRHSKDLLMEFVTNTLKHHVDVVDKGSLAGWRRALPYRVKVLLFSDKSFVQPLYALMSNELSHVMDFGLVAPDARRALMAEFQVPSTPFVVFIKDEHDLVKMSVSGYSQAAFRALLQQHSLPRVAKLSASNYRDACGRGAARVKHCIALLTGAKDPSFARDLKMLQSLAGHWPGVRLVWVDRAQQRDFAKCYGADASSGPSVVTIDTQSPKFYLHSIPKELSAEWLTSHVTSLDAQEWETSHCVGHRLLEESLGWTKLWRQWQAARKVLKTVARALLPATGSD